MAEVARSAAAAATYAIVVGTTGNPYLAAAATAAVSHVLAPKIEDLQQNRVINGLKLNPVNNITPRNLIYGERIVGGVVFNRQVSSQTDYDSFVSSQTNQYLHQFIALTGHEISSFQGFYVNNQLVTTDSSDLVDDEKFRAPIITGGIDKTTEVIGAGVDGLGDYYINIGGLDPNTTYAFRGQTFTVEGYTIATWNTSQGLIGTGSFPPISDDGGLFEFIIFADFSSNENGHATVYIQRNFREIDLLYQRNSQGDLERINRRVFFQTNVSYTKAIRIIGNLGSATQTATYDNDILDSYPDLNQSNVFAAGNAYLFTTTRYHPDIFRGIPTFQAKVRGKIIYDTRTSTSSWSRNPAMILRDYLTDTFYGLKVPTTKIDDTTFNAAANVCDESVAIESGGSQDRYTCDLVLEMAGTDHRDNIESILATMAGTLVFTGGKYKLYAGAWNTPTLTIDESWLIGGVNIVPKISKRELFNTVKGIYVNTDQQDEYDEFPNVTSASYVTADNEDELIAEIQLLGVTDIERAQRLAKIYLQRHRYSETIVINCNYKALQLEAMDTVYFSNDILGYSSKSYRVTNLQINENGNGFLVTLQHEDSGVYTWTASEATIPTSGTSITPPTYNDVAKPGNPVISEDIYETSNGSGVKVKAIILFSESTDGFVNTYQVEYKLQTRGTFIILGRTQSTRFEIPDISAGVYDFRVKAINGLGYSSDYAQTTKEIIGLTAVPGDITDFSINVINNNAHLSWDQSTDLDVKIGGQIIVKHTPETATPSWSNSLQIIPAVAGKATSTVAPLITGTYLIKAQDSVGNVSQNAQTISATIPNMTKLNVVTTQTEDSSFTGTKTNMIVSGGLLTLDGDVLFDSSPGFFDDASGNFDSGFNTVSQTSGSYEFSNYIDLGKVVTSRASISIDWVITEPGNNFDDYDGLFDSATGYFDGTQQDPINVIPYIRKTDDDPSGSPTWSSWQRFYIGDFTCRAYEFKIDIESQKNNFNLEISALSATVDMPDVVDSGSLTTSASSATTVNFNQTFYAAPDVTGTIVNGATGDYITIASITATSFSVSVKDSSNNFIAKDVIWMSKGY